MVGPKVHHDAVVEDHAIRFAHQSVTARAHLQRVEGVGVHPIEELDRIRSLDVDLAERGRIHHRHALSRRVAFAQHRRFHVLVMSREVPGPLPLADVLEDGSVSDVPGMDGGHANRVEEVAAISAGHQPKRHRHVRGAERCHAYRADGLPQLRGHDGGFVDARRLALVAAGADGGEPLDVLNRLHAGAEGSPHIRHGHVPLEVDEMSRPILPIARDHPVGHDRALAAPTQIAGRGADDVDVRESGIRHEARQALVVPKATLRLAEQVQRGVEAARNAEQIALDFSFRVGSRQ